MDCGLFFARYRALVIWHWTKMPNMSTVALPMAFTTKKIMNIVKNLFIKSGSPSPKPAILVNWKGRALPHERHFGWFCLLLKW